MFGAVAALMKEAVHTLDPMTERLEFICSPPGR